MNTTSSNGYSGTPLARELGIREACRVLLIEAPSEFAGLLEPLPHGVIFEQTLSADTDIAIVFALRRTMLAQHVSRCRKAMRADAIAGIVQQMISTVRRKLSCRLGARHGFHSLKGSGVAPGMRPHQGRGRIK